jgi:hypothetical protein
MTFTKTRSETLLEELRWYQNYDAIQSATTALEGGADPADVHGPATDACHREECNRCYTLMACLIEMAARSVRRDKSATLFDVMRSPLYQRMLKATLRYTEGDAKSKTAGAISEIAELSLVGSHVAHGLRTYEVSEGLLERLKLTGLNGVPDDEVRLPFASTMFQFPRGCIRTVAIGAGETSGTLVDVTGVLLREFAKTYSGLGPEPQRMVELSLFGHRSFDRSSREFMVFTIELPLNVAWSERLDLMQKFDPMGVSDADFTPFIRFMPVFWDLLVNLILYATWPEAGQREEVTRNADAAKLLDQMKRHQKGTHKHDRAKTALKRTPLYRRIVLGRTVTAVPHSPTGEGGLLKVRTLVQGHWMRVAIGPGKTNERKDRKWIYREPFWRGPEGAPEGTNRHRMV